MTHPYLQSTLLLCICSAIFLDRPESVPVKTVVEHRRCLCWRTFALYVTNSIQCSRCSHSTGSRLSTYPMEPGDGEQPCTELYTEHAKFTPYSHFIFIPLSVLRQVRSLFQSEFSTECDLVLPVSISSTFAFCYCHSVAAYVFFLVVPSLLSFLLSDL